MKLKNFDFTQKVYLQPEHVVKLKNKGRPFPMTIEVDLTNHCNHRCTFCCWGEDIAVDKSTLKTDVIKKCIKDMKELGAKAITFTGGGEPMIHKDFYEVLAHANNNNFDCGLITNGSAITKENVHKLFENLQWTINYVVPNPIRILLLGFGASDRAAAAQSDCKAGTP